MRIVLTGVCGFIASNIVRELVKRHDVIGVDNLLTGFESNISDIKEKFDYRIGSLVDPEFCQDICRGADMICHQAALPSVPRSVADPLATNQNNVVATLNLLKAAVDNDVSRFVYASSSSVYGDNDMLPRKETQMPMPKSPYAVSKLVGEYYLKSFCNVYGLDGVSLRYFNVFGPRQNPNSQYSAVVPKFMLSACDGSNITVHGDGMQTRDFTYVENVVQANLAAIECVNRLDGAVVNIASGRRYSLMDLISYIEVLTGKHLAVDYESDRAGDVKHSLADIGAAKKLIGYTPDIDFNRGVRLTHEYYKRWYDARGNSV